MFIYSIMSNNCCHWKYETPWMVGGNMAYSVYGHISYILEANSKGWRQYSTCHAYRHCVDKIFTPPAQYLISKRGRGIFYLVQSRPLKGTSPYTILQPHLSVSTRFFTGAFYIQKITVDIHLIDFNILFVLE